MNRDQMELPASFELPSNRAAAMRETLIDAIAASRTPSDAAGRRWWAIGRKRAALAIAALGLLIFAGSALGIRIFDYLSQQEEVDRQGWIPPDMTAVGTRVEVARGADWSFMTWKSTRGICVAYAAGTADGWARACGSLPEAGQSADENSKYLVVLLTAGADSYGAADGRGAIVGAVTPKVARVELELSDGRVISTQTQEAPVALNSPVRVFLLRTQLGPSDSASRGPRVRTITSYSADGAVLERFTLQ